MEKKFKDFQALGQAYGIQLFNVYYTELLSSSGRKGARIIRVESNGQTIPVKEFIAKHRISPELIAPDIEFIGTRGYNLDNKIKIARIKLKTQSQENK
jgi:hypothetical protein